jgi:phage shock protein PspC (stress-responsive transcriptional regulator)
MTTQPQRLYRSRTERMIGGVCGGLAQFFTIDVTIIRLIFVFTALFWGTSLLIYLVMLLVVPEEPLPQDEVINVTAVESQDSTKSK